MKLKSITTLSIAILAGLGAASSFAQAASNGWEYKAFISNQTGHELYFCPGDITVPVGGDTAKIKPATNSTHCRYIESGDAGFTTWKFNDGYNMQLYIADSKTDMDRGIYAIVQDYDASTIALRNNYTNYKFGAHANIRNQSQPQTSVIARGESGYVINHQNLMPYDQSNLDLSFAAFVY